jgi:hypothetical protein
MRIPALQVVNSKTFKHAAVEFGQVSFFPSLLLLMLLDAIDLPYLLPKNFNLETLVWDETSWWLFSDWTCAM